MIDTLARIAEGLYYFYADETFGAIVASIILTTSLPAMFFGFQALWWYARDFARNVWAGIRPKNARKDR